MLDGFVFTISYKRNGLFQICLIFFSGILGAYFMHIFTSIMNFPIISFMSCKIFECNQRCASACRTWSFTWSRLNPSQLWIGLIRSQLQSLVWSDMVRGILKANLRQLGPDLIPVALSCTLLIFAFRNFLCQTLILTSNGSRRNLWLFASWLIISKIFLLVELLK